MSKEKLVVKAARDNPSKFGNLISKIDQRKLSVDSAYKEVKDEFWKEKQITDNGKLHSSFLEAKDKVQLFEGHFKGIASDKLEESSIDLIFTDPPYKKESLPLYKDLASIAERVLRPGGSLITYIGQYALLEIGQLILNNSS